MFTEIWNTSVWGWYVYQWWLSVFFYEIFVEKKKVNVTWNNELQKKIDWLKQFINSSVGRLKVERKDVYLEGFDTSFEDINLFKKHSWWVWYGFIQSKSTKEDEYNNLTQIKKIILRFLNNKHFLEWNKCVSIIASNVEINASHKRKILSKNESFISSILNEKYGWEFCESLHLSKVLEYLELEYYDTLEQYLKNWVDKDELISDYRNLLKIFDKTYFFDKVSPKEMIDFIKNKKKEPLENKFYRAVYKATRRKKLDNTDDDFEIYKKYPTTKFWWDIDTDIIDWGFYF